MQFLARRGPAVRCPLNKGGLSGFAERWCFERHEMPRWLPRQTVRWIGFRKPAHPPRVVRHAACCSAMRQGHIAWNGVEGKY